MRHSKTRSPKRLLSALSQTDKMKLTIAVISITNLIGIVSPNFRNWYCVPEFSPRIFAPFYYVPEFFLFTSPCSSEYIFIDKLN